MGTEMERELNWDDTITKDSDFVLLPEGDYDFFVESYERGRHGGSDKLPPCHKAILKIRIDSEQGSTTINHNLFLHTVTEGMLSAFFTSIGQKKKGEPLRMNWSMVPGARGRLKLGVRHWKDEKKGTEGDSNEIKRFYPAEESAPKFTPGRF